MNKLKKKADISEFLVVVFVFIPIIFLIAYFVILPSVKTDQQSKASFQEDQLTTEGYHNLLTYARMPAEGHKAANMAELIAMSYENNDYAELKKQTSGYFNGIYDTSSSSWKLRLKAMPENKELEQANNDLIGESARKSDIGSVQYITSIRVPLHQDGKHIEAELFRITLTTSYSIFQFG